MCLEQKKKRYNHTIFYKLLILWLSSCSKVCSLILTTKNSQCTLNLHHRGGAIIILVALRLMLRPPFKKFFRKMVHGGQLLALWTDHTHFITVPHPQSILQPLFVFTVISKEVHMNQFNLYAYNCTRNQTTPFIALCYWPHPLSINVPLAL